MGISKYNSVTDKIAKTCSGRIERSKMSILKRIPIPWTKVDGTIRFVSKFYTKNIFHDFFENFDPT